MKIGDLVLAALDGPVLEHSIAQTCKSYGIQNFILFSKNKNYSNPVQLIELTTSLQKQSRKLPAILSVDHEGGLVQRFREGFTRIPDAMSVGKQSTALIRKIVQVQASELFAAGINLNFAPCADIQTNPDNPIIGSRAYGTDAKTCSRAVKIVIEQHLKNSVIPCVKHFPGHGDTNTDSHLALPSVGTDLATLKKRELIPFRTAIRAKVPAVMTAHIIVQSIDSQLPGTLSEKVLSLLNQMRFNGIVFSDDFQMKAIADHFGLRFALKSALLAGVDIICTNTWEGTVSTMETLQQLVKDKELPKDLILKKLNRIQKLRSKIKLPKKSMKIRLNEIGNSKNQEIVKLLKT